MDLERKAGSAFLFELRGKRAGSDYVLPEKNFRIGSDKGNDLIINDREISLFQAKVSYIEGQFVLQNISPLGTAYINGESFEDVILKQGDIITLGERMYRYISPGETMSQEELWRPVGGKQDLAKLKGNAIPRKPLFVLTALVVIFILFIMFSQKKEENFYLNSKKSSKAGKELKRSFDRQEIKALYSRGKDLLGTRRWDEAVLIFESIRREMPSFMDTEALYQKAIQESEYLDLINQGKGLYIEHNSKAAIEVIKSISERSYYHRERERLMREIDHRLMEERISTAQVALKDNNWLLAKQEAKSILNKFPNNKEAYRVLMEARALQRLSLNKQPEQYADKVYKWEEKSTKVKPASTPVAANKSVKAKSGPARGTSAWHRNRAITAYIKGNTNKSLEHLERIIKKLKGKKGAMARKTAIMIEDIRYAETYYQQAKGLQTAGRYSEAIDLWEKFLSKDRSIVGKRQSVYFQKASISLSTIYYHRGKNEFDKGAFPNAFFYWNMARQIYPKGKNVKSGLVQLDELAMQYYREGYSLQEINLDKAIELWKKVLIIVSPSNSYYKKAKKKLAQFGP